MSANGSAPKARVSDRRFATSYEALATRPIREVTRLYAAFGLDLPEEARRGMRQFWKRRARAWGPGEADAT